ncbi:MAG: DNA recombination/repair protein RecA, partial [Flavobacteriia bacterium]|nr:DNA recombination/repair protein RecA [Flavobacteriia bacterium]
SYGDTKIGQGRDAVKTMLLDNPELMEELEKKIMDTLKAINS